MPTLNATKPSSPEQIFIDMFCRSDLSATEIASIEEVFDSLRHDTESDEALTFHLLKLRKERKIGLSVFHARDAARKGDIVFCRADVVATRQPEAGLPHSFSEWANQH